MSQWARQRSSSYPTPCAWHCTGGRDQQQAVIRGWTGATAHGPAATGTMDHQITREEMETPPPKIILCSSIYPVLARRQPAYMPASSCPPPQGQYQRRTQPPPSFSKVSKAVTQSNRRPLVSTDLSHLSFARSCPFFLPSFHQPTRTST